MEELKKHQFYVILVGVLVVYLAVYIFLVGSSKKELNAAMKNLQNQKATMSSQSPPDEELLKDISQRKELVKANAKQSREYLARKEKYLEQWFQELEIPMGRQIPDLSDFHVHYFDRRDLLRDSYRKTGKGKLQILDDAGHDVDDILPFAKDNFEINSDPLMIQRKKEFWIIKAVLEILQEGKMQILSSFRIKYDEKQKTGEDRFFARHEVEFTGTMNYGDIPFLMERLLEGKPQGNQPPGEKAENSKEFPPELLIELISMEVKREENYEIKKVTVLLPWELAGKDDKIKAELDKYAKEHEAELRSELPSVTVIVKCRVLDYEPPPPPATSS